MLHVDDDDDDDEYHTGCVGTWTTSVLSVIRLEMCIVLSQHGLPGIGVGLGNASARGLHRGPGTAAGYLWLHRQSGHLGCWGPGV